MRNSSNISYCCNDILVSLKGTYFISNQLSLGPDFVFKTFISKAKYSHSYHIKIKKCIRLEQQIKLWVLEVLKSNLETTPNILKLNDTLSTQSNIFIVLIPDPSCPNYQRFSKFKWSYT